MKLFMHFNEDGQVISVAKVHGEEGAAQNPFFHAEQERVLEIKATEELRALDAHEIAEQYVVDVKNKRLKKRQSGNTASPETEEKATARKTRNKSDRK
jgi:hypothetical protein